MSGPGWYSFGRATHGELGRPSHTGPEGVENADVRPIKIEGVEIETIACGHFHNIALSTEHQVFAWGANGHGQLGTERDGKTPAAAQQLQALLGDEQISHFCAGRNHSVFLSSTGRPFISGGLPAAEPGVSKVTSTQAVREISVTDGSEEPEGRLVAVAVGESQTFFLSSEGELWSWLGEEDRGERRRILGHFQRPTARAVLGLPRVAEVTCGLHHTLILTEERKIFSFGAGSLGQLGLGLCRRCPTPSQVMFPPQCDGCLCGIAAGFASSFAVTEQGWVYSWGCNEKCELGLGTSLRGAARPKPIDALYQVKVTQVAAGFAHTACVTDSGLLYLWGYGAYGQLGFGFDDLRSSMRLGNGWSACKASPGVQADDAGFTSTGQSQPWQQVWPRRCRRGPFRTRRCVRVECGAYHTIAQASKVLLGDDARNESEVLCPLPLEVSDLPAGTMALMEADQQWPPGAGLAECPRPVLRQKATRTVEIFRSLADLFWETKPCKTPLPETPSDVLPPQRHPVEGPRWRRALKAPVRSGGVSSLHPLQNLSSHHTSPRSPEKLVGLPLPGTSRVPMTTWTEVDEAVHKAFQRGDVSAPLPELLAELVEVSGPFKEPPGLPSSPSQGLARLECLTPRPFYLPEQEPDLTNISGAPVPIDAEDALNKPMIQGILPEEVEVAEKSPDHSAAKDEAENAAAVDGNEAEGDVEEVAEKNPEEFAARADEDAEASEVVEKDPSAAETAAADVEVAEQTPDESAAAEDVVDVEVPVPPNGTAEDVEEEEKETQEVVKEEEEKETQEVVKEEEEKEAQEAVKEEEEKEAQEVVKEEEEKETQEVVKEEEEKETQEVVKEEEEKEAQEVVKEEEEKEAQEVVKEEEEKEAQEVVKEAAGSSPEPSPREAATAATAAATTEAAEDGAKSRRNRRRRRR